MTGPELKSARDRLKLTAAELGRRLYLTGRDPGQSVRLWETGKKPVPGPVRAALEYMLRERAGSVALAIAQTPTAPRPGASPEALPLVAGPTEPAPASGPVDPPAIGSATVSTWGREARARNRRRG